MTTRFRSYRASKCLFLALSPVECGNIVKQMVNYRLVTKQTPPEGVLVQKVSYRMDNWY